MSRVHPLLLRTLAGVWLAVVAVVVLALAAELWLQLQRRGAIAASERFRATNVFFANGMELNVGNHSLWQERWQEYAPGAKLDVTVGGRQSSESFGPSPGQSHTFAWDGRDAYGRALQAPQQFAGFLEQMTRNCSSCLTP